MKDMIGEISIRDIPDEVLNSILHAVADYTVGFLRVDDTPPDKNLAMLGSGVLVTAGSVYAILTAHHVVKVLPRSGRLGLILSETISAITISTDALRYLEIARGIKDAEGPDLGAVILSPVIAAELRAKKTFHNLDKTRERFLTQLPDVKDGLWILQGFVEEWTKVDLHVDGYAKTFGFYELSSSGIISASYSIGDHDYFVFPVSYKERNVPHFGGTSGGGLWQVPLVKKNPESELTHKTPQLAGVAFYQEPILAERSAVKCHGRRSVYEIAYQAILATV